jgi:D-glycero-D-manno-heptose 1,7-bisphosphate phosphatase
VLCLRVLRERGYALVVVTNQRGIARGFMSEDDVEAVHEKLRAACEAGGAPLAGVYHCPHDRDTGCPCRKPEPGMLLRAAEDLGLDLARSVLVGDSESDVEAGRRAGVPICLLVPSDEDWGARLGEILEAE